MKNFLHLFIPVMNGFAQTFQNLDFESASIVPIPNDLYHRIEFQPAFPGWSGFIGDTPADSALFNNFFLNSAGIGLQGDSGQRVAFIESGVRLGTSELVSSSLSHTAILPAPTRSIQFRAQTFGNFELRLGNASLPLFLQGQVGNFTVYAVDATAFAGQLVNLQFVAIPDPLVSSGHSHAYFDDIVFSSVVVSEPSVIGMSTIGTFLIFTFSSNRQSVEK